MPQGGVARRATLIRGVRQEASWPVLVLEAGNALLGEELALQSQGKVIVEAMNLMGYDAMGVGPLELAKGVEVLLQRAEEADFAILACNLVWAESQAPVLAPFTILERGGVRFGIVGVTSSQVLLGLESKAPGVVVLDPVESVRRYVAELRPRVDVLIVLSHLGLEEDRALAERVEGIDVIVGGRTQQLLSEPYRVGQTVIVQAGYDGEWLGRLDMEGSRYGLDVLAYRILSMKPDVPDDPEMVRLLERYRQEEP